MSDGDLVRAAVSGDTSAFGAMYDAYSDRIFSFAIARVRDANAAADITQDTFVQASRKLGNLRDPERFGPWLFAIARNTAIDHVREQSRFSNAEQPLSAIPSADETLDADLMRADAADLLWDAADGLNDRDRDLFELQLRHGLEGNNLADALGVTTKHLQVLQSRLKNRVEKALGSLLVARHGRSECADLRSVLAGWDGRFNLDVRSVVTRHVEACEVCSHTRSSLVAPAALLGVLPLMPAPVMLRAQAISSMSGFSMSSVASGDLSPAAGITIGAGPDRPARNFEQSAADTARETSASAWMWRPDGFPTALDSAAKSARWWTPGGLLAGLRNGSASLGTATKSTRWWTPGGLLAALRGGSAPVASATKPAVWWAPATGIVAAVIAAFRRTVVQGNWWVPASIVGATAVSIVGVGALGMIAVRSLTSEPSVEVRSAAVTSPTRSETITPASTSPDSSVVGPGIRRDTAPTTGPAAPTTAPAQKGTFNGVPTATTVTTTKPESTDSGTKQPTPRTTVARATPTGGTTTTKPDRTTTTTNKRRDPGRTPPVDPTTTTATTTTTTKPRDPDPTPTPTPTSTTTTTEAPGPGKLEVDTTPIDFRTVSTSSDLRISNVGGKSLKWTATWIEAKGNSPEYFSLSQSSGGLEADASTILTVSVDRSNILPGRTVRAVVRLSDGLENHDVSLSASAPPASVLEPVIKLSVSNTTVLLRRDDNCPDGVTNTTVTATVTHEAGIAADSVFVSWNGPKGTERALMKPGRSDQFVAVAGGFGATGTQKVTVEAKANDANGTPGTATADVNVTGCLVVQLPQDGIGPNIPGLPGTPGGGTLIP